MKLESHHEISKRIRISRVIHFSFIVISLSLSKINIFWIKLEFRYRLRENFNIFPTKSFRYLRFQFQNNKTKKLIFRIFNNYDIIKPIDQTLFLFNFFFFYPQNARLARLKNGTWTENNRALISYVSIIIVKSTIE